MVNNMVDREIVTEIKATLNEAAETLVEQEAFATSLIDEQIKNLISRTFEAEKIMEQNRLEQ